MRVQLVVVRHGEADHNVAIEAGQGPALRYTEDGTLDSPLTSRGRDQVQLVGKRLEGERFDLAVSSDLVRAVDTGLAITGKSHLCLVRCQVILIVSVISVVVRSSSRSQVGPVEVRQREEAGGVRGRGEYFAMKWIH